MSPPPLPGQLRRPEPNGGIEAPPPPSLVHQVAHNQHIDQHSAARTIPPPPSSVQQEAQVQSQQVHRRSTILAASPPPSPVQRAIQGHGVTQSNTWAREDLHDDGTALSPSTSSRRFPPKFLPCSHTIVDSPRSNRQPSPPSDPRSENEDRRRRRCITRSTPQDPPSHLPCEHTKKFTLRVPPRRK
jgi:hypothetical protein